jgi:hypothetical protein
MEDNYINIRARNNLIVITSHLDGITNEQVALSATEAYTGSLAIAHFARCRLVIEYEAIDMLLNEAKFKFN